MAHRVLLAGLFHETHTFLEGRTTLADFEVRRGQELWSAENDGSPLSGALEIARAQGWEVIPAIDLRATPGPTVDDQVVELFWNELAHAIDQDAPRSLDGIYLVLHGAMVSASLLDVEGEILERLRAKVGASLPIGGVLDLHGNITEKLARHSQAFVAYRQNPHADACAAARDGARLLERLMQTGEMPTTVWLQPPVMWPPTGTGTAFEPMQSLEAMARKIEEVHEEILAVNVFAGFSFADTPDTGVSFTAVTLGEPRYALAELEVLADWAVTHRELGNVREQPLAAVLHEVQSLVQQRHRPHEVPETARTPEASTPHPRPIILAEPSDNIGGGAPGDGVDLLRALISAGISQSAVAINDPDAVTVLQTVPLGSPCTLTIGRRNQSFGAGPFTGEFTLVSRSDGKFVLEDLHSHLASMSGCQIDMGPCAVLTYQNVTILLTSRKTPPFDLGQWRSQGIIPESMSVIAVKAAVAHRRVYDPIAAAHFTVETPGPCSSNLRSFPFRHVRRPIFPLDE
ncbi:MAG: M81 family metallopeptidase [Planctomycetes bacterium]|nr:M81 family metallopeptidase [Planctomycetota bacterium]